MSSLVGTLCGVRLQACRIDIPVDVSFQNYVGDGGAVGRQVGNLPHLTNLGK